MILPKEEFSYNNFVNNFPRTALELWKMEQGEMTNAKVEYFSEHVKNLHEEVYAHIAKMNL